MGTYPLIPAEAGTQYFGYIQIADRQCAAHTWVPASAGMSGELR